MKVLVSLRFRPRNWQYRDYGMRHSPSVFCLTNSVEDMEVWIANGLWGLHFKIGDKTYGGVIMLGWAWPWRWRMRNAALRALANPWVTRIDRSDL